MGASKKLTEAEKSKINAYKELELSNVKIERKLKGLKRLGANYGLKNPGGRPKSTSMRTRNLVIRTASNKCTSARAIKSECDLNCSVKTIQRVLKNTPHLKYTKPKRKPALKPHHIQARLSWAEKYVSWTDEWKQGVFSDEKKFNLDGPDGLQNYWHDLRKDNVTMMSRNFGGGSVMVWGAFGYKKKSEIVFLNGRQNAAMYQDYRPNEANFLFLPPGLKFCHALYTV
uniref:Transposase Tc1-like domain-containing protein n=1 Tax=Strigamia maritima TaxID=126957 RepID=T1IM81_STRMM